VGRSTSGGESGSGPRRKSDIEIVAENYDELSQTAKDNLNKAIVDAWDRGDFDHLRDGGTDA
jgi:hypothetical protein